MQVKVVDTTVHQPFFSTVCVTAVLRARVCVCV